MYRVYFEMDQNHCFSYCLNHQVMCYINEHQSCGMLNVIKRKYKQKKKYILLILTTFVAGYSWRIFQNNLYKIFKPLFIFIYGCILFNIIINKQFIHDENQKMSDIQNNILFFIQHVIITNAIVQLNKILSSTTKHVFLPIAEKLQFEKPLTIIT